jgi:TonB family protein
LEAILFSMFNGLRFRLTCVLLLASLTSPSAKAGDKHKGSPCDKPREVASPPQLSKEAQVKARKIRAQGYVAIVISEDGDVTDAKVIQASSPEAVDLSLEFARSAKFKPRMGYGPTQSAINYTLADQ